jgi:hypothetical protein
MPDPEESRRFDEIVAHLRAEGFRPEHRGRLLLTAGIVLCLTALGLILFGGVKGAVYAVLPWLVGMFCVVKSRGSAS